MTETETRLREYEADLVVSKVDHVADDVVVLTLVHPDGGDLPPWTPGAHIDLIMSDELVRQYSLCSSPTDGASYQVGVLKSEDSRGGSKFIHEQLNEGDTIRIRGPRNHFPLVASARYLFIAGGIGITPMIPMIEEAVAAGAEWSLVYGGRTKASMAFLEELAVHGDRVTLLPRDSVDRSLSARIDELLGDPQAETVVYCCGPEPLLEAAESACASWPSGSLHLERFQAKDLGDGSDDHEFEVVLARTGVTLRVPPGRSIFRVCEDNGISVLGSCHEGVCGTCETVILEGEADHRDVVLSDDEKESNESLMVCVSRARFDSITLDL